MMIMIVQQPLVLANIMTGDADSSSYVSFGWVPYRVQIGPTVRLISDRFRSSILSFVRFFRHTQQQQNCLSLNLSRYRRGMTLACSVRQKVAQPPVDYPPQALAGNDVAVQHACSCEHELPRPKEKDAEGA